MAQVAINLGMRRDDVGRILRQKRDIERYEAALERILEMGADGYEPAYTPREFAAVAREALGYGEGA